MQTDNFTFLSNLLVSLSAEIESSSIRNKELLKLKKDIGLLQDKLVSAIHAHKDNWHELYKSFLSINQNKASLLNMTSMLARDYPDMDAFWQDAELQAIGQSQYTFWDTYEHGRRRQLEQLLADSYGCDGTVLVNSGMGAICAAIDALSLQTGDTILTTKKNYFETSDHLDHFIQKRGINIRRVDIEEILEAYINIKPKLLLVEVVGNYPEVPVIKDWQKIINYSKDRYIILDNTVQSHLSKWYAKPYNMPNNVIVVESATKYLTEDCVAGVIYGNNPLIERIRHYVRNIGISLQEKCFNYFNEGLLKFIDEKMRLHSRNTGLFSQILRDKVSSRLAFVRTLDYNSPHSSIFQNGKGCLIYLQYDCAKEEQVNAHRTILNKWKEACGKVVLPIKAGFGWSNTIARVYESNNLNQKDAPNYMRISVGIEPEELIRQFAEILCKQIIEYRG